MTALPAAAGWLAAMLGHPYLLDAFLAGTGIGLAAGTVGYFLVLRAQVFTADALSHVAFTGAFAALVLGLDLRGGLFAVTVLVALGMGAAGRRARPDDVVIGGAFAWVLGIGVLLLSLYTSGRSAGNGSTTVSVLFGSVFGLSTGRAAVAAGFGVAICALVLLAARPLLLSSLAPRLAAARGMPVRLLGLAFLAVTAATVAEATQVVGSLLILGLVAAPAGAATRLVSHPYRAMLLSAGIATGSIWVGLTLSYVVSMLPPSFTILAVATATLAVAVVVERTRRAIVRSR